MSHSSSNSTIDSPIVRGIKEAGVGKKGSKPLDAQLASEILSELKTGTVSPARVGAFFGSLINKGVTEDEKVLGNYFPNNTFKDPERLVEYLCADAPEFVQKVCVRLLKGEEIDRQTTYELGKFLLSDLPGDTSRGLVASILRVRYETADEYQGLLQAINETIVPDFRTSVPTGDPVIQLAEPFDGVDHSFMITPCVSQFLQTQNFRAVNLLGRNSGPKLCNNLYDIVKELKFSFTKTNADLHGKPQSGFYIDQKDLSPALDRWVDIRHQTIKRPFLATLEKFLDPCKAKIIITSAFHGVYGEKMTEVAERAGFSGSIVVRNGIEGTIAFPLKRPAKLLCSARQKDGSYVRHEIIFDAVQFLGFEPNETKLDNPSLKENAKLIQNYLQTGKSGNDEFDQRVKATREGLKQATDWISKNAVG